MLFELAELNEFNEDNPFRIRAFRRGAEIIESLSQDVGTMDREELLKIPGIGKGLADMIEEFKAKGEIAEYKKLQSKFPEGLFQIMKVQGLGAKRTAVLFKSLHIDTLEKLAQAAREGKIAEIPGFGEKVQENILKSVSFVEKSAERILQSVALSSAEAIKEFLAENPVIQKIEVAGSLRRWKETIGDLDFLCTSHNPEKAIAHFLSYPQKQRALAEGTTKASLVLKSGLQCDFRVVEAESFGAALLYFTGSKEHNVRLRELALHEGFTLNEYGLFRLSDKKKTKPVAARTEEEVYKRLGLPFIPPELREDRGEIEAGRKGKLPTLVTLKDILGDFHNHTTLSDGKNTPEEMIQAAEDLGWKWYFCGDHSPALNVALGLSAEALRKKLKTLQKLGEKFKKIKVFSGSEVDILPDGKMDYPDPVLAELDVVVASVHSRFKQSEEEMTARICRALENPNVDILGHISGRLINTRPGYTVNYETILEKARVTQTAIEINGQPDRLELSDVHVKRAIELGVPLALTTDAHSTHQLTNIDFALHVARRGWAEAKNILNTYAAAEILKWLKNE